MVVAVTFSDIVRKRQVWISRTKCKNDNPPVEIVVETRRGRPNLDIYRREVKQTFRIRNGSDSKREQPYFTVFGLAFKIETLLSLV